MAAPSKKLTSRITPSLRLFVIFAPIRLPIRVIDISAPRLNRPMPAISMADPIKNASISPGSTGTISKHSASTMAVTGKTDAAASRIFSNRTFLCISSPVPVSFPPVYHTPYFLAS